MMKRVQYGVLGTLLASSVVVTVGCKKPVVLRDPDVYKNEIAFMQMALEQDTELLEYHLNDGSCVCEDGAWTTVECEDTALNILVVQRRLDWHVAMMLYLGNQIPQRPPEEPPEVPDPSTLCPGG